MNATYQTLINTFWNLHFKIVAELAIVIFPAKDETHIYEGVKSKTDAVNLYDCLEQERRDIHNEYINTELSNSWNNVNRIIYLIIFHVLLQSLDYLWLFDVNWIFMINNRNWWNIIIKMRWYINNTCLAVISRQWGQRRWSKG